MPKPCAWATASRSPASRSAAVVSGRSRSTSSAALSRRVPIGTPAASRSIRPPTGSGVAAVRPASSSAFEFTQLEWPSAEPRSRRAVGEDRVEVAPVGDAAREERQVPAAAEQPGTVAERGRRRRAGAPRTSSRSRLSLRSQRVSSTPPRERVGVPVVEAGEDEAPAELHHSRLGSDEADNIPVGADEDDPVAGDGDRLGPAAGGIHGVDLTVPQHEVGRDAAPRRRASGGRRSKKRTGKGGRGERDGGEQARQPLRSESASGPHLRALRPAGSARETRPPLRPYPFTGSFSSASSLPNWGPSRC